MENTNTPTTQENIVLPDEAILLTHLAIDDAVQQQMLTAEEADTLKTVCNGICAGELSGETLSLMLSGLRHDADVTTADAEGYVRGKNEKISALYHFSADSQRRAQRNAVVPRFVHRSIWDID